MKIYSFAVTIIKVFTRVMKTFKLSLVLCTRQNILMFSLHSIKIFMVFTAKESISSIYILLKHIIANIMISTLKAYNLMYSDIYFESI